MRAAGTVNSSCPPLEVLDFLPHDRGNATEVLWLSEEWPCEVRLYWLRMRALVALVRFLFEYGTVALVAVGIIVNIYSLFVLSSPPINKCNISVYLKALAVSDIGALICNVGVGVLQAHSITISNVFTNYAWMCAIHRVSSTVFFYYSSWLVVTFTFERLLMIKNPFKIHTWSNERPAKVTVIIIAVVTLNIAILRSMTSGFERDNMYGYKPCGSGNNTKLSTSVIPFMVLSTILPTLLISIANICLLFYIRKSAQEHSTLNAAQADDGINALKITRMLIVISIFYVILYLPVGIVGCTELYYRNQQPTAVNGSEKSAYIEWKQKMLLLKWVRGLCFFLYLMNFVNNFFLYCLSGDIFRQTVKLCLPTCFYKYCCCLKGKAPVQRKVYRANSSNPIASQSTRCSSERHTSRTSLSLESYCNRAFSDTEENHM